MKISKILFVLFLLITPVLSAQEITLLYTSSLNGNLDGCECVSAPKAGLVSSAVFLREEVEGGALFFDLGDSLDVYPDPDLSEAILTSYSGLGITASAVGDQEFIEGVDWLKEQDFPYLSHNILIDGRPLADQFLSLSSAGVSIGVAGINDPGAFFFAPQEVKARVEITDPDEASRRLLSDMEAADVTVKILLYHGSAEEGERLFGENTGWDVVLAGHDQRLISRYGGGGKRFFGSPGENGNRVGILKIGIRSGVVMHLQNRFHLFNYMEDPKDSLLVRTIDRYKRIMVERLRE